LKKEIKEKSEKLLALNARRNDLYNQLGMSLRLQEIWPEAFDAPNVKSYKAGNSAKMSCYLKNDKETRLITEKQWHYIMTGEELINDSKRKNR
jgi:hypothetical protein